jgi:hypothetical protein
MNDFIVIQIDFYIIECVKNKKHSQLMEKIIDCAKNNVHKKLFLTWFWENVNYDDAKDYLHTLVNELCKVHQDVFFILDNWYKKWNINLPIKNENILFIDFFLILTYICLEHKKTSKKNTYWNYSSKKFLMLVGKPARSPRTLVLFELYKQKLIKQCNFSYHIPTSEIEKACRTQVNNLTESEWNSFKNAVNNTVLDKKLVVNTGWTDSKQAFVFDADIYSSNLFAINIETMFDRMFSHPWLTEKTWMKIANKIPFINVSEMQSCKYLNQLGIKTFNEYMAIENYDDPDSSNFLFDKTTNSFIFDNMPDESWLELYNNIKDITWPQCYNKTDIENLPQDIKDELSLHKTPPIKDWNYLRIDAVIRNAQHWLSNLHKFKKSVINDLEHNFQIYQDLGNKETQKIVKFLESHNVIASPELVYAQFLENSYITAKGNYHEKN